MSEFYVIMVEKSGDHWPLGLQAQTFAESVRAIRWQHTGGNYQEMLICRYDAPNRVFVSVESKDKTYSQPAGRRLTLAGQGAFTALAWSRFNFGLQVDRPGSIEWHFFRSYVGTALGSSNDESDESGGEPMASNYDIDDIAAETLAKMRDDCALFYVANSEHIHCDGAPVSQEFEGSIAAREAAMAGHDFWLTRCGHGAGFWDGDWPQPHATALDTAAKAFGNVDLYIGDDGQIYA